MRHTHRRSFLRHSALTFLSSFAALGQPAWSRQLQQALADADRTTADHLASDEDFWYYIQQSFTVSSSLRNFNNGGVSPAPKTVQEAMKRYYDYSNEAPSYFMWRILDQGRETLRNNLAQIAGCSAEEIAINRNASEGLETVIFGLRLKAGDEVVASLQDYPNVVHAWKQRALRDGITIKWVNLELPSENEAYLVQQYVQAFTPQTKVVCLTHIINWNGQVLPVRAIADAAHRRGIEVLIDGAHSFAHLPFSIPELGGDYFATSLHKWLYAPIGSGLLWVRKEKIGKLFPLLAAEQPEKEDIRKFENLGTRPFFIEQAIGKAVEFHEMLGADRKHKRLLYLKNYWMERVGDLKKVKLHTSLHPKWGGAIGLVEVEGKQPAELDQFLFNNYKIHTTTINWENIHGVRITPNVYTTTKDLDALVAGIRRFAALA